MKIRVLMPAAFLIIAIILIAACGDRDSRLSITPEIDEYTPAMSSVPGIGLIAGFSRDLKNKDYKFHWVAERGTFLKWHDGGKGRIEVLGNDIKTNEHKVYWTVDPDENISEKSFLVYLTVEEIDTSEVMYETSIRIDQDREGYFSIK